MPKRKTVRSVSPVPSGDGARAYPQHEMQMPGLVIGVMGSAGGAIALNVLQRVYMLGEEIARRGHTLVTGAAPGLPHEAVRGAKAHGGFVVGISPALNLAEHVQKYRAPTRGYDVLVYTGSGLMGREIENIRTCDVVVFAGGRSGTLGEFAIAYDESKIIGALRGTGGITDHLDTIVKMVKKETGAIIRAAEDPAILLDELEEAYERFVLPAQMKVLEGHNPDGVLEQDPHGEREGSGLARA